MFKDVKNGQDVSNLYKRTKAQLGWNTGGPPQALIIDGKLCRASQAHGRCTDGSLPVVRSGNSKKVFQLEESVQQYT